MPILATPPEKSLDYEGDLRWSPAINTEATDHVPPYGVCYAVGIDDQGNIEVAAPNVDGVEVLVADSMGILAPNGGGIVTRESPVLILYDETDGTPAVGEVWGAKAGEFALRKGYAGFECVGYDEAVEADTGTTVAMFTRVPNRVDTPVLETTLTSAQTAWDLGKYMVVELTSTTEGTLVHGIDTGYDGRWLVIHNNGGGAFVLKHASGSASAVDRINCPFGLDQTIIAGETVLLHHDGSGWLLANMHAAKNIGAVTLATNQTAWDLSTYSDVRVTASSASLTVGGIDGGWDGRRVRLWNVGVNAFTLEHNQETGTTAADRIICDGAANIAVPVNGFVYLQWFDGDSRWRAFRPLNPDEVVTPDTCGDDPGAFTVISRIACVSCELRVYTRSITLAYDANGCLTRTLGPEVYAYTAGCCDSSCNEPVEEDGSGSGQVEEPPSEPPTETVTGCCDDPVSTILAVTVTDKTGLHSCLPDVFYLEWDGSNWTKTFTSCGTCDVGGNNEDWMVTVSCSAGTFSLVTSVGITGLTIDSTQCDPLSVSASAVTSDGGCVGQGGSGSSTWTIDEWGV